MKAGLRMQNLQLDRPLVCFDLETTGIDVQQDRIVQVAMIRLEPGGKRRTYSTLVNPGRPIPAAATAVHGIDDAMVLTAPRFDQILDDVLRLLEGADLSGFNFIRFDLPLLEAEIARHGRVLDIRGRRLIDAMTIFHRQEPRHLEAAVRFYCGRELAGAHSAQADAEATLAVLDAQLARYPDLPRHPDGLHEFCNPDHGRFVDRARKFRWNNQDEAELVFGKHAGKTLRAMAADARDRGYLEWILGSDFAQEVKDIVRRALGGDFPTRG
jgi:DNA polymerase III subunit epsilon